MQSSQQTVHSIQIRAENLPAPPRVYHANVASAVVEGAIIALIFGERWPGDKRLNSAICVRIPAKHVRSALPASFVDSLNTFAKDLGTFEESAEIMPADYPSPDRRAFENASLVAISFAEHDASFRMYRLSATKLQQRAAEALTPETVVVPCFEVTLSTGLLAGFVARLDSLTGERAYATK